jgi:hypothetical protein
VWNPDRIRARGPCGYNEVAKVREDDQEGDTGGSEIKGETGNALGSAFSIDVGSRFCEMDLVGRRILYFDFPFVDVVVGAGTGIGTGVAVLDVSVEPDKEDGPLIADMESDSNGFLAFPFSRASSCALANLNLAVIGVSVFSLDSLDEDSAGDDGRDRERERDGESAGVEGVLERWREE